MKTRCNRFAHCRNRDNLQRKPKQQRITDFFNAMNEDEITHIEVQNIETIHFAQNNHQKRIASTELITNLTESQKQFVILGQEPSTFGYNVTGVDNNNMIIQGASDKPRSYVCVSKNLNAWAIEHLCSRDVATCIINTKSISSKKILACSIYWDGRIDTFPAEAEGAMKMARENNYILVMGGDANAQNSLFGGSTTNKRGKQIEDLLVQYDLAVANKGNQVTCTAGNPGSIIDITLINGECEHMIKNWRVSNKETLSDHKLITFEIECEKTTSEKRRKMNDPQKEAFTRGTRGLAFQLLDEFPDKVTTNVEEVENLAHIIVHGLKLIEAKNSTEYTVKVKPRTNFWYVDEVWREKKQLRILKHEMENARLDPLKRRRWKDQESKLTNLHKKYKEDDKKGNINSIAHMRTWRN